jgi:hypothetical protein
MAKNTNRLPGYIITLDRIDHPRLKRWRIILQMRAVNCQSMLEVLEEAGFAAAVREERLRNYVDEGEIRAIVSGRF